MSTTLRDPREIIREEMVMQRPILRLLEEGPLTVPEIADKLGHPTDEVVFWVMGMRRYGHIVEVDDADDDGYFRYANAHQEVAS
ncbi:MAG: MarR family transcriptional regulator [Cellulomonas sp.]|nr:MarR family transcriptional regulator [Cellulomonas sp.]